MRKISVFTNISLDGYFEGPGHDITAFKPDSDPFSTYSGEVVDTVLLGHHTYEIMKFWETPEAHQLMPEIADFMNSVQKVVVSRQPFEPGWKNVVQINTDVPGSIRELKEQPGGRILIFGSNQLVVCLMQAGLIDKFQLVVNPVALTAGTPIFSGLPGKTELELVDVHPFKSGAVMLTYKPLTA